MSLGGLKKGALFLLDFPLEWLPREAQLRILGRLRGAQGGQQTGTAGLDKNSKSWVYFEPQKDFF